MRRLALPFSLELLSRRKKSLRSRSEAERIIPLLKAGGLGLVMLELSVGRELCAQPHREIYPAWRLWSQAERPTRSRILSAIHRSGMGCAPDGLMLMARVKWAFSYKLSLRPRRAEIGGVATARERHRRNRLAQWALM